MVSGRGCILSIGFVVLALIAGVVSIAHSPFIGVCPTVCENEDTVGSVATVLCLIFLLLAFVSGLISVIARLNHHREPLGDSDSGEYYRCTACFAPVRSTAPRCPRCHNQKTDFFDLPRRA